MRALIVLGLIAAIAAACGGGASSPPIQVSPAVTNAPSTPASSPGAPAASPASTGGYDYGY